MIKCSVALFSQTNSLICVTFTIGQIIFFVHYFLTEFPHVLSALKCEFEGLQDWFLFMVIHLIFPHPPILVDVSIDWAEGIVHMVVYCCTRRSEDGDIMVGGSRGIDAADELGCREGKDESWLGLDWAATEVEFCCMGQDFKYASMSVLLITVLSQIGKW